MSDFERLVSAELTDFQRDLLVAMLAKLACADGHVDPFEEEFLGSFLGPRLGNDLHAGLRKLKDLSDDDIAHRGSDVAETLYVVCSLMACVDEHVDDRELATLVRYADALGVDPGRRDELDGIARRQILTQCADAMKDVPGFPPEKGLALAAVGKRLRATDNEIADVRRAFGFVEG